MSIAPVTARIGSDEKCGNKKLKNELKKLLLLSFFQTHLDDRRCISTGTACREMYIRDSLDLLQLNRILVGISLPPCYIFLMGQYFY